MWSCFFHRLLDELQVVSAVRLFRGIGPIAVLNKVDVSSQQLSCWPLDARRIPLYNYLHACVFEMDQNGIPGLTGVFLHLSTKD